MAWWAWLGEAVGLVRANLVGLGQLAWPWYGAAAVVLVEAWLLFGVSPFAAREVGGFWWPALVQEILLGLSGAAIAVRMTRHVALGEPLVDRLRRYLRLMLRYALRFVLQLALVAAVTAGAALIVGGLAGLKGLMLPEGSPLLPLKQALVALIIVLVFAYVSGRLHVWLTAAALDRRDVDFKTAWLLGKGRAVPLLVGTIAFYLPAIALDLAILRLVPADAGLALTLPAFVIEAASSILFTAALAAYFARLFAALAAAPAADTPGSAPSPLPA